MTRYVPEFVRTCDEFQKSAPLETYKTTTRQPIHGLLNTFSMDSADLLPETESGKKLFLMGVEHLRSWHIVRATATENHCGGVSAHTRINSRSLRSAAPDHH